MPTVLRAVQLKIASLTAANFPSSTVPPVYLSPAAVTTSAGVQVYPPYGVLDSKPGREDYGFEDDCVEEWPFTLELHYGADAGLAGAEQALKAIRWNGQAKSLHAGLDYGTLPDLSEGTLIEIEPSNNPPRTWEGVGKDGRPVYSLAKDYVVRIQP